MDNANTVATNSHGEQLASLIGSITGGLPPGKAPGKDQLDALFGVLLRHAEDAPDDQRAFVATPETGPIGEVEYRESNPGQKDAYRLVVLRLRPSTELGVLDVAGRLFPVDAERTFNRRIPPDGVMSYIVQRPGLTARFQFGAKTEKLQLLSFKWTGEKAAVEQ
jgi:hypothetical protein